MSEMTAHSLAMALSHNGKVTGSDPYKIRCILSHNHKNGDRNPSFEVKTKPDGQIAFQCHGPCEWEDVFAEIKRRELNPYAKKKRQPKSETFKPWEHTPVDTFVYMEADGTFKYEKRRYLWEGERRMAFWHKDAKGGWARDGQPLLYNLPEVAKAAKRGDIAVCVEGETDVKYCMKEWNFAGFSLDSGAGSEWSKRYAEDLKGLSAIYFCHDNDEPGYGYANAGCSMLTQSGFECYWVELPGIDELKEGADVRDWMAAGHSVTEFEQAVTNAALWTKEIPCPEHLLRKKEKLKQDSNVLSFESEQTKPAGKPKRAKEPPDSKEPSALLWTDIALGQRFIDRFADQVKYAEIRGWHRWDGMRYRRDPDHIYVGQLAEKISQEVTEVLREARLEPKEEAKAIKYVQSVSGQSNLLKIARRRDEVLCDAASFDSDPDIINTASGVINLKTGAVEKHDRKFNCSRLINPSVKYDPKAKCPRFIRFLQEIFDGDAEMIGFVKRALGYALTGHTREQKLFFLFGEGRNGKSMLLEQFKYITGEYSYSAQPETWMRKSQRDHAESLLHLVGKRGIISGEVKQNDKLDEGRVKNFSGRDTITTRALHQNEVVEYLPVGKLFLFGNHKPQISDPTNSIWKRLLLIPFEVQFENPDTQLDAVLRSESDGIFFWLVCGAAEWYEEGLMVPSKVESAVSEYRAEMDTPEQFLNACCERDEEGAFKSELNGERASVLYMAYMEWCKEQGFKFPKTMTSFGSMLRRYKIVDRKFNDGSHYQLQLKEEWRPPEKNQFSRFGHKQGRYRDAYQLEFQN